MATRNQIDNALSGATGTGNFVGSNSPTLVTPILGASNATSIDFGGGALNAYVPATSFTPTFSFNTPGDLSVSYATQIGYYQQKGHRYFISIKLVFTPTYTTSATAALITIPVTNRNTFIGNLINTTNTLTYAAGKKQLLILFQSGVNYFTLTGQASGSSVANMTTAQFVSGTQYSLRIQGISYDNS